MRGYFSQLGKQSGLHLAASGGNAHSFEKPEKQANITPLHQAKSILVSPDLPALNSANSFQKIISPKQEQPQSATELPPETKFDSETKRVNFEIETRNLETPGFQVLEPATLQATDITHPKALKTSRSDSQEKDSEVNELKQLQVAERAIFKNAVESPKGEILELQKLEISKNMVDSKADLIKMETDRKDETIEYFNQTSQILEGTEATPQEIQQIFLREVQEWAAGPQLQIPENNRAEKEQNASIKFAPQLEEEATVLRETPKNIETERSFSDLEEQNLSLSIGTISIVIEDSEGNVQSDNLSTKNYAPKTSPNSERKFPRLSRRYL